MVRGKPLTVERARRELARLVALRERGLKCSRQSVMRRLKLSDWLALAAMPDLMALFPCFFGRRSRKLTTRFERLQRVDKFIWEREEVIAG